MPLDPRLKLEAAKKLEQYEGRVNHFYLDSNGNVTVGVGCLVPNKATVSSLAMYKVAVNGTKKIASLQDKQTEYENIVKLTKNNSAAWYKRHTVLIMGNSEIDSLRDRQINSFYRELTNIYGKSRGYFENFDQFPRQVKMALLDMIFNLGARRLSHVFMHMNASIRIGDWNKAAQQCHRKEVGAVRNQYVRHLFLSAVRKEVMK